MGWGCWMGRVGVPFKYKGHQNPYQRLCVAKTVAFWRSSMEAGGTATPRAWAEAASSAGNQRGAGTGA